jgi:hypothetical protein
LERSKISSRNSEDFGHAILQNSVPCIRSLVGEGIPMSSLSFYIARSRNRKLYSKWDPKDVTFTLD